MNARPYYVIINDTDAPQPQMVCQWVHGIGYCYMDRHNHKDDFDGMAGSEATAIEAFGFSWHVATDGMVHFEKTETETATYRDGKPRRWQSQKTEFSWRRLKQTVSAEG